MSIPDSTTSRGSVKTLAIRLEPDLHAQLSLIAQLRRSTITDEIRAAIDAHIKAVKADPALTGRADAVLEAIERDASARRDAIATLFGAPPESTDGQVAAEPDVAAQPATADPAPSRNRGRRGSDPSARQA